jgi:pyruvate/2-oxoglutarate dehydrogenase complex dihydrolipoamide acyltransferase (E2) component
MKLDFSLPCITPQMTEAVVHSLLVAEGQSLAVGHALMELTVDLSAVYVHDCPPISYYRIASREAVWLRKLSIAQGDSAAVGTVLARFTTTPGEPADGDSARQLRVMIAGVMPQQSQLW